MSERGSLAALAKRGQTPKRQDDESDDEKERAAWGVKSRVEVYSQSSNTWFPGDITKIFFDEEGEWLEVQYPVGRSMRMKQIPRDDKAAIRAVQRSKGKADAEIEEKGAVVRKPQQEKTPSQPLPALPQGTVGVDDMSVDDMEEAIRGSWVQGAIVEIYSRGKRKWMRGLCSKVFTDAEGEWLEIRYGSNLAKEVSRDSPDIRPLRARFRARHTLTRSHINQITAIWEDVDFENTRHLDSTLLQSALRALNVNLELGEMEKLFRWIDVDSREAVTVDEFIKWMSNSTESVTQQEMQERIWMGVDATVQGKLELSSKMQEEEKAKLERMQRDEQEEKRRRRQKKKETGHRHVTSNFDPAAVPATDSPSPRHKRKSPSPADLKGKIASLDSKRQSTQNEQQLSRMDRMFGSSRPDDVKEETKQQDLEIVDTDRDGIIAEFSDKEDDMDVLGDLPGPKKSVYDVRRQESKISDKLRAVGLMGEWLVAKPVDEQNTYTTVYTIKEIKDVNLRRQLKDVQVFMQTRVSRAGEEGIGMYDLARSVHQKFQTFDRRHYIPASRSKFADFVANCPGLVVLEDHHSGDSHKVSRYAVTEQQALKVNLSQKLNFVLTMLFDKAKVTNDLKLVSQSGGGRRNSVPRGRRLSVGEKLLTVHDFGERMRHLGMRLDDLERDELFWAVAGTNGHLLSQKAVGQYFGELVMELHDVKPEVVAALPRVIELARLRYRRAPLWKQYIIQRTKARCNAVSYVSLVDRRTRSKRMEMIMIPRARSIHGETVDEVQRSFHNMCHILNKLQYPTVVKKYEHGCDKFNFCCVLETPPLRSFPDMLSEAANRGIPYSEYFIAQVIGSVLETVVFCHKHNCVNLNLNLDHLGFDSQLRPILLDFSRSLFLAPDDKTTQIMSVMSSTPPELALLMGSDMPAANIELNGEVLRRADSWRVGVLLYTLVSGSLPYPASSLGNFITAILTRQPTVPIQSIQCSQHLKNLISSLLETAYFNRLEVHDALRDPWFQLAPHDPLPEDVYEKICTVDRLENARSWISAVTHHGYAEENQLARDHKYFARLDPTGQRRRLRLRSLKSFMEDRMGYSPSEAKRTVERINKEVKTNKYAHWTWEEFETFYEKLSLQNDLCSQLTNAVFRGLDPEGLGKVPSKLLRSFFKDINLKLRPVLKLLSASDMMDFDSVNGALKLAFEEGFDISDLLSVDHIVRMNKPFSN